ncbi:hypothetical protein B0H12DRAFT_217817 [Mycena haematopus]|nr:hypothetical protein B0H12DRAFT_217817 [Mycena haematopus]
MTTGKRGSMDAYLLRPGTRRHADVFGDEKAYRPSPCTRRCCYASSDRNVKSHAVVHRFAHPSSSHPRVLLQYRRFFAFGSTPTQPSSSPTYRSSPSKHATQAFPHKATVSPDPHPAYGTYLKLGRDKRTRAAVAKTPGSERRVEHGHAIGNARSTPNARSTSSAAAAAGCEGRHRIPTRQGGGKRFWKGDGVIGLERSTLTLA